MVVLVLVVVAATASVLVVNLGERLRLPWPALMVLLGAAAAFVPGAPELDVDPGLILPLFLPPLLYAAAQRTSFALFRSRWRSIVALAVALTAATVVAVTATAAVLVPSMTVTAAVALGAAVAPPDPVAVEAVAGQVSLPRRLLTVLQSEGLFNDAVALVVFQAALAALASGDGLGVGVGVRFVYGLVAATAIGYGLAWAAGRLRDLTDDTAARAAVSLVLPFAVYLAADAVGASGVVAVVVAGLGAVSHLDADDTGGRLTTTALWGVVEVVVTGLAVAVLVVRRRRRTEDALRDWREATVLTWGGMRGLATLALALALPSTVAGGAPFPGRTEAVVIACSVLAVTLLLPAFTLPALMRALEVREDEGVRRGAEAEITRRAREAARSVLLDPDVLRGEDGESGAELQERAQQMAELLEMLDDTDPAPDRRAHLAELRQRHERSERVAAAALAAARSAVVAARGEHPVDPEVVDRVLRRLDVRSGPT